MRPGHGRHSAKGDVKVSDHGVGDVDCGETRRIHDDLLAPGAGGGTDSNDGPIYAQWHTRYLGPDRLGWTHIHGWT